MIAMSGEQVVVFAIIAGAGYWVVSLLLNKMFPSRGGRSTVDSRSQEVGPEARVDDPERARRSVEMRNSFPPPPVSMTPPELRGASRRCADPLCCESNPANARFCSKCGQPLSH